MEEVYSDYQLMRYNLPDLSERPKIDSGALEFLSTELASLRKELELRNTQIDQLMRRYKQHKRELKEAAYAANIDVGQLDKEPSLLLDLKASFRLEIMRLIVQLDSVPVKQTYLPNSRQLTLHRRGEVLDNMNNEYWLPHYIEIDNAIPAYLPRRLNVRDSSPLLDGDLELEYIGTMFSEPGSIRTDCAISCVLRVYYFEVTILCKGDEWYYQLACFLQ